ncbi:MAG: hypothetical protein U0821_03630 [Chloroflexota bacterium]
MSVFKSVGALVTDGGHVLGQGRVYVHVRLPNDLPHTVTGTMSLTAWDPGDSLPVAVVMEDGGRLDITVTQEGLSDCSRNRVLRFLGAWPPR